MLPIAVRSKGGYPFYTLTGLVCFEFLPLNCLSFHENSSKHPLIITQIAATVCRDFRIYIHTTLRQMPLPRCHVDLLQLQIRLDSIWAEYIIKNKCVKSVLLMQSTLLINGVQQTSLLTIMRFRLVLGVSA